MGSTAATFTKQLHQSISDPLDRYYGGGQILWVGNRGAPDAAPAGDGSSPRYPLSSVFGTGGALARLNGEVKRGSVILCMPGHAEPVAAASAGSLAAASTNFAVVGLGRGSDRATFTWTTATSSWLLNQANTGIANCRLFLAGAAAAGALTVAAPITVSADGCFINDSEIHWGWDADSIVGIGINVNLGTRFQFDRNVCYAETAAAPSTTFLRLTGADFFSARDTSIVGPGSSTTIGPVQELTTASLKKRFTNCVFESTTASSTVAYTAIAGGGSFERCAFVVGTGVLAVTASSAMRAIGGTYTFSVASGLQTLLAIT